MTFSVSLKVIGAIAVTPQMNFGAESPTERPKASRCWTCLTADTAEVGLSLLPLLPHVGEHG